MAQGTKSISSPVRIGICAPSTPFNREEADRVVALAAESHPQAELIFDEQCFLEHGHFAGNDEQRLATFVALANDPAIDAIWFARGGYGAARIADAAIGQLGGDAGRKTYLGYSDAGNLLGALYRAGIGHVAHGPMPSDIGRIGGEDAIGRALDWIVHQRPDAVDPGLASGRKYAAFNLMTLAMMTGTKLMPDLRDHILIIEEISEYLYAFDRAMFHLRTMAWPASVSVASAISPKMTAPLAKTLKQSPEDGLSNTGSPILGARKSDMTPRTALSRSGF